MDEKELKPKQNESQEIFKNISNFFQSRTFKIVIWGIVIFIVFLFVFRIGMMVGFNKARFSYQWGENYHLNFAGPRKGFFRDLGGDFGNKDFIEAHGVFGQIIKIDGSILIIRSRDNVEKNILVKKETIINRLMEKINLADLKINDEIVVIGEPNESGQIEANLIRILPNLPPMGMLPKQFLPPMP